MDAVFKNLSLNEKSQFKLYNSYKKISKYIGCYYMGYILEDSENHLRVGFTTNQAWGQEYLEHYIQDCHLWNQVQNFFDESKLSSFILPWSIFPPLTKIQKDIFLRRRELYIGSDGISFCKKKNNLKEYYYFAPEINQRHLLKYITNNLKIIKSEISIFRNDTFALIKKLTINKEAIKNG